MGTALDSDATSKLRTRPSLPAEIAAGPTVLRQCRLRDLDDLLLALTASADELRPWVAWLQGVPTEEQSRFFLRRAEAAFDEGTSFAFNLWEHATGQLVGQCAFELREPTVGEVACWIRADRYGRGYATTALDALRAAVAAHLPEVTRLEIHVDPRNTAAAHLPRRLGYHKTRHAARGTDTAPVERWALELADCLA